MSLEVLFLLLPVAALSGWLVGRGGQTRRVPEADCTEIPADYFKGLNYLLNEQQDRAIEVFTQMLEADSNKVETHLALGSLFRRRGEVDRAIRIHQNLIARPMLEPEHRNAALFELGQDYLRAGVFDRAETLFRELVENRSHSRQAFRFLLDIYQQEKDWDRAIQAARRLESVTGEKRGDLIAHYYCELAEEGIQRRETAAARKLLRRALSAHRGCARASLIEARLELDEGNYKGAIRALKRVEQQDADFLPEITEPLIEAYSRQGRTGELRTYLEQLLNRHAAISIMLALVELVRREEGEDKAGEFIAEYLRRRPSVRGMDRLIEINLNRSEGPARANLQILKDVTDQMLMDKPVYKCANCGFTGRILHWQCPGCKQWNTVKPIHGVEGE